jgi:hypothetical protein
MNGGPPPRPPVWVNIEDGWSNDPAGEARFAVETICSAATLPPGWAFEGRPLIVTAADLAGDAAVVTGTCAGATFRLELTARADGWVEGRLIVAGIERLHLFLERPWEEYEFYPPGHSGLCEPYESPGRLGKKLSWGQIRAEDWPSLENDGYRSLESVWADGIDSA